MTRNRIVSYLSLFLSLVLLTALLSACSRPIKHKRPSSNTDTTVESNSAPDDSDTYSDSESESETQRGSKIGLAFSPNPDGTSYSITGYTGKGTVVVIPETCQGLPVTAIAPEAFQCCPITEVTIPDTITSIGNMAFSYCDDLTTVTIGEGSSDKNITIGEKAFAYCPALSQVTIGDTVTKIGASAFVGCKKLTNVIFETPDGWQADGTVLKSTALTTPTTAATYLADTYKNCTWTRP